MGNEGRKQNLYFPATMIEEITAEARRLDRSMSWILQQAWRLARRTKRESTPSDPAPQPPNTP